VDLPADLIQGYVGEGEVVANVNSVPPPVQGLADPSRVNDVAKIIRSAKAPLVVLGKGAAYAQSEEEIREFIERTHLPFLPTPMGKGILPDSHPQNTASARSTALKEADVVLVLGARLNWILHFGAAPKWNPNAVFIQVDISPEEIGKNTGSAEFGLVGDVKV
jgi:2-hydroxyacyl-CoA lyase 1